jgi:hypothetical protein
MIFPNDTGNGACADFDDIFVSSVILLLEEIVKRFLYLLVGRLNSAFNQIDSFLFLKLRRVLA